MAPIWSIASWRPKPNPVPTRLVAVERIVSLAGEQGHGREGGVADDRECPIRLGFVRPGARQEAHEVAEHLGEARDEADQGRVGAEGLQVGPVDAAGALVDRVAEERDHAEDDNELDGERLGAGGFGAALLQA